MITRGSIDDPRFGIIDFTITPADRAVYENGVMIEPAQPAELEITNWPDVEAALLNYIAKHPDSWTEHPPEPLKLTAIRTRVRWTNYIEKRGAV